MIFHSYEKAHSLASLRCGRTCTTIKYPTHRFLCIVAFSSLVFLQVFVVVTRVFAVFFSPHFVWFSLCADIIATVATAVTTSVLAVWILFHLLLLLLCF